ncbi:DUF6195 family protein [Streptomyces sp. NPDC048417]|uniref:DUF6195 family protein n=1 Tax=Streptomyces sp. NPDC048417 TaxID=3155387 RepID=UPI003436A7D2
MSQSLIAAARAAYTGRTVESDAQRAENEAKAASEFIADAHRCARDILGEAADVLSWDYTPWDRSPKDTEEATAVLDPGHHHSFALRYSRMTEPTEVAFALLATCVTCGCHTVNEVSSLAHLGQLLEMADQSDAQHQEQAQGVAEPLECLADLPGRASLLKQVAARLTALYPKASLRIDTAVIWTHADGDGSSELHLRATSAESAAKVAQSLGAASVTKTTGDANSYVMRRTNATATVDGITVQLAGYTRLSDDETAAWLAEQQPAAEDGEQ